MEESWRDRCSGYDSENGDCRFAVGRGWLYNRGTIGVGCPFEGSLSKCNDHTHPPFENDQQVSAYLKYGIEPGQNIPLNELCLENISSKNILMAGVRLHNVDGSVIEMREDGSWKDVNR
mgnify:CR=1 FL=1